MEAIFNNWRWHASIKHQASKTMNSETFCAIANAFKLSVGNFSRHWSASAKVSCWAVLSPAPLVLLSCRNSACSLAWWFWMCLIKLVALYFAVLPPPLETFTLQTLQTAVELVGKCEISPHCWLLTQLFQHATHMLLTNDVGCAATEWEKKNKNLYRPVDLLIFLIPDPAILSV